MSHGLFWFLLRRSQVHRAELFLYHTHLTRNVRNNRHLFTRPLVKYSVRSPGFDSHLMSGRVRINQWDGCETSVGAKRPWVRNDWIPNKLRNCSPQWIKRKFYPMDIKAERFCVSGRIFLILDTKWAFGWDKYKWKFLWSNFTVRKFCYSDRFSQSFCVSPKVNCCWDVLLWHTTVIFSRVCCSRSD